jgi:hypothetical protein
LRQDFLRKKRNEDLGQHEMHDRSFSSSVWCNVCKRKIRGKQVHVSLFSFLLIQSLLCSASGDGHQPRGRT